MNNALRKVIYTYVKVVKRLRRNRFLSSYQNVATGFFKKVIEYGQLIQSRCELGRKATETEHFTDTELLFSALEN